MHKIKYFFLILALKLLYGRLVASVLSAGPCLHFNPGVGCPSNNGNSWGGETVGLSQGQSRLAQVQESMGKYQIPFIGEITVYEMK